MTKHRHTFGWIAWLGLLAAGCLAEDVGEVPTPPDEEVPGDTGPAGIPMDDEHRLVPRDFDRYQVLALMDTLPQYAAKCDAAIGVTVPDFNCETGTVVPTTNYNGTTCDRPNRLNSECDPSSRFQVISNDADAYVVAHCRKQGHAAGRYGDIAVIQHNKKNGATCFYQALGDLDGLVQAPSKGSGAWPWYSPASTANIKCVRCHDNGPLVRSPYLTQLTGKDRMPGSGDPAFNRDQPYHFVGADFASWRAYQVEVGGNTCNGCHRMGTSNQLGYDDGTALDLGIRSTAPSEVAKNPHSPASPIWMTPGLTYYNSANAASAQDIRNCALRRNENPLPDSTACRIREYTVPNAHTHSQAFGGNLFAEDHYYVTPQTCSPGFARSGTPQVQWTSQAGGYCEVLGWYNPGDQNDCRVRVHARTGGGFFGGTCTSTVLQAVQSLPNLATGRPATQSSTVLGGVASRALDRNAEGNWGNNSVTHTDYQAQPWWQVDLGAIKSIDEVVLYNRTDCCADRLADFDILLSNDGASWQVAASFAGLAPVRTALAVRALGRYVRVRLRGTNYLSLAEVQVLAPPDHRFLFGDVNLDGRSDIVQGWRGFGSLPTCRSTGAGFSCSDPAATLYNWGDPAQEMLTGDFDGDGRTDVLQAYRKWGSLPRCLSTGTGWSCANLAATIVQHPDDTDEQRFMTGRFDGDGRTDVIQVYRKWNAIPTCRSTGTGWSCSNPAATIYDSGSPEQQFLTGDVNGDGLTDVLQAYRGWGSIPICTSTGTGWSCSNQGATIYNSGSPEQQFLTGDFNGDGRTDVAQAYRGWGSIPVCTSTGTGWSCNNLPADIYNWGSPEQQFLTGDFNGDGRTDVVQTFRRWGSIPLCLSTGTGWSCANLPATIQDSGSREQRFVAADMNGDGRTDIVQVYRGWSSYPVCYSTGTGWSCTDHPATKY